MDCHHIYIFAGSLVLVGGDPGVGKSSLLLQVNIHIRLFSVSLLCFFLCFQAIKAPAFFYLAHTFGILIFYLLSFLTF